MYVADTQFKTCIAITYKVVHPYNISVCARAARKYTSKVYSQQGLTTGFLSQGSDIQMTQYKIREKHHACMLVFKTVELRTVVS